MERIDPAQLCRGIYSQLGKVMRRGAPWKAVKVI